MDTYIQKNRKRSEESGESSNVNLSKKKKYRKYGDQYLDFGFTCITKGNVELPQCVVCHKVLAAESMLPNKLKRHLESTHSHLQGKPRDFFVRKLRELKHQATALVSRASIPTKALLASYMVAYRVAKCKKPHTIAEDLILPAAVDMVTVMIGESAAKEIENVPLSNNTVSRRIHDMAEDINEQIVGKLSGLFAIQLDEATDSNDDAHLICNVRFMQERNICEDLLFCRKIRESCKAGFQKKLLLWKRKLEDQEIDCFPALQGILQEKSMEILDPSLKNMFTQHVLSLSEHFEKYFPEDLEQYNWIRNPFQSSTPSTLSTEEEEQLIELSCESSLKFQYKDKLFEFWSSVSHEYHAISTAALKVLLPFAISYLCETAFLQLQ